MSFSHGAILNGAPLAAHAFTALPIAAGRAVLHERSSGAVEDPLARKLLLGAGGSRGQQMLKDPAMVEYFGLRKTVGDELVREMYTGSGVRQVVSIGAGLCARPFRLPHTDVKYFEVDSQELFDMKEPLVADLPFGAKGCTRSIVPGFIGAPGFDLRIALSEAGHDATWPTVWLMEGLLMYLTSAQTHSLATDVGALSAPGSALWGDAVSATSVANGIVYHGVPFSGGLDDYDEVFGSLAGFDYSEAFDMGGVELQAGGRDWRRRTDGAEASVKIQPWARITKESVRGRPLCIMVRAYKTACANEAGVDAPRRADVGYYHQKPWHE